MGSKISTLFSQCVQFQYYGRNASRMGVWFSPRVLGWLPVWESRVPVLPHTGHRPCWKQIQQPEWCAHGRLVGSPDWRVRAVQAWPGPSSQPHRLFHTWGTHPLTGCVSPMVNWNLQKPCCHGNTSARQAESDCPPRSIAPTEAGVSGRPSTVEQWKTKSSLTGTILPVWEPQTF